MRHPIKNTVRITLLIAIFSIFVGCASSGKKTGMPHARKNFTPTERLIIDRGTADQPMDIVYNSSSAGDAFLRTKSLSIDDGDPSLDRLISRMDATVRAQKGVGIAAPQVGINRRVIIVQRLDKEPEKPFDVYLNPRITKFHKETVVDWEGCLSVPDGFAKVRRPKDITVKYDTPAGARRTEHVEGFTARIFQHEIDHLNGILFIDVKEPGPLMPPAEYREMRQREKKTK